MTVSVSSSAPTIRPMRRADLPAVRTIDAQAYGDAWSRETWLAEIGERPDRVHLVAEVDGRIVGHGGSMLVLADVHITTVAVEAAWHRRGVARRLVTALLVAARASAASAATLEVRASNAAAISLYRSFGFAPVGARRNYYPDPGGGHEDAIVMWLLDLDGDEVARRLVAMAAPDEMGRDGVEPAAVAVAGPMQTGRREDRT